MSIHHTRLASVLPYCVTLCATEIVPGGSLCQSDVCWYVVQLQVVLLNRWLPSACSSRPNRLPSAKQTYTLHQVPMLSLFQINLFKEDNSKVTYRDLFQGRFLRGVMLQM